MIVRTSDFMMIIRQSIYILSIITREMGKLKTHSPIYCIMDNRDNMLNLTHTSTKYIWQAFYNFNVFRHVCTMMIMRWCYVLYKQTNTICKPKRIRLFALIINCTMIMKTKSLFSQNVYAISDRIWCKKHLRHTTTENMITMGKADTSDLMMIITWAIDISFQSPKLKWPSWTHTIPYILMKMKGNR